jgi:hypothetical protein
MALLMNEIFISFPFAEALFLDANNLNGTIPGCFGHLTELKQLYLFQNQLSGTVPVEFQNLRALSEFHSISSSVVRIEMCPRLNWLTHPVCFCCFRVGDLGLESNKFTGEVPGGVCDLVEEYALDIWADCTDQFGKEPLLCSCCNVCCPGDLCV